MYVHVCLSVCLCYSIQAASQQAARDNRYWPNSSKEDRKKDQAANLPLPQVSDATWVLSEHDVECLVIGAGILGCGGGGDPQYGRLQALKLLREGKEIKVVNPCRVEPSSMGLVCGVAYMGAPLAIEEKLVGEGDVVLALRRVQQVLAAGGGGGVCEEGGCDGGEGGCDGVGGKVKVTEKTCDYFGATSFPVTLADEDDLKKVSLENVPLVSVWLVYPLFVR